MPDFMEPRTVILMPWEMKLTNPRSGKWPTFEKGLILKHPYCCICGRKTNLVGHHKLPFHLHPELELDEKNIAIICEWPTFNCHLWIGHGGNFRNIRPDFDAFAKTISPFIILVTQTEPLKNVEYAI